MKTKCAAIAASLGLCLVLTACAGSGPTSGGFFNSLAQQSQEESNPPAGTEQQEPAAGTDAPADDGQTLPASASFSTGIYATERSDTAVYEGGGVVAELTVEGDQVIYTVTSVSASGRFASISGAASQGGQIAASGDDGWGNIVKGTLTALGADSVAVEFETVSLDPAAMWDLGLPYTVLTRCAEEEPPAVSGYPIQIRMDNLMSANLLGDTFWSAYAGGWIEEWMFLYVHGGSDPDILYEPFWYDEQLGEWTYYGITYAQAEEAGWGGVWTEILANNGYTRF